MKRNPRLSLLALPSLLAPLAAQCEATFGAAGSSPGADAGVYGSTLWDPDGPGPAVGRLVLAGSFTNCVDARAPRLAVQDPATGTWSGLAGLQAYDGFVVTGMPNGDLVVGGGIATAGGVPCGNVARWDGVAWHTFGIGVDSFVYALAPLPNGDLVVGGLFTTAGGGAANHVARWNGTSFQPLGGGTNGVVYALAVLQNGDLVAGGSFTQAGGVPAPGVARWDGTAWSSFAGAGMSTVQTLQVLGNGDLIVGGSSLQRWDGSRWQSLGFAANGPVNTVRSLPNGDLVACGSFTTVNGQTMLRAARYDGSSWSALGSGLSSFFNPIAWTSTVLANGDLVVGGRIESAGGRVVANVARWDGAAWHGFGTGVEGSVGAIAVLPGGDVVASGSFQYAGDQPLAGIGRWDGARWQPLASGLPFAARALAVLPNGDLVSSVSPFGGCMARWDGTAWSPMAQGIPGEVRCLAVLGNGDVVAGGVFNWAGAGPALRVARWNGTAWSPMGAGFDAAVNALAALPDGTVVAGGAFNLSGTTPTPRVARWDGSQWQPLGNPQTVVQALAVLANGSIVAAGEFVSGQARTVQQWTGSAWTTLGTGMDQDVRALRALPNGGLLAGGPFSVAGGVLADRLAYWSGSAWSGFGSGLGGFVQALDVRSNGDVVFGGNFTVVANAPASHVAILQRPCAGVVDVVATPCVGPAGPLTLRPDTVPGPNQVYRATARGFAPVAIALHTIGFQATSLPLPGLLPIGVPGCDLLVTPDLLDAVVVAGDSSTQSIPLVGGAAWLGLQLHQQFLQLADIAGAQSLSSSNALRVQIGY